MLFGKRNDGGRAEAVRRVKGWVQAHAHAREDEAIVVTELHCREEGCPPVETVLAVLHPRDEPRTWKVYKPIVQVTEDDVRVATTGRGNVHDGHAKSDRRRSE